MPRFHQYGRNAYHDLGYLSSLGSAPSRVCFLSERSFYILLNLVAKEATYPERYATELLLGGYTSVEESSAEWGQFLEIVDNLGEEVYDVSDDVISLLQDIKQTLGGPGSPYGVQAIVGNQQFDPSADVGANYLTSPTVPSGEIWRLESTTAYDVHTQLSVIETYAMIDGKYVSLVRQTGVLSNIPVAWTGSLHLGPGDYIETVFVGCNAGDDLYLNYSYAKLNVPLA